MFSADGIGGTMRMPSPFPFPGGSGEGLRYYMGDSAGQFVNFSYLEGKKCTDHGFEIRAERIAEAL